MKYKLISIVLLCHLMSFAQYAKELEKLKQAKKWLKEENYTESQKIFTDLYKTTTNSVIAPEAFYYAAYSSFKIGNYKDANYILFQLIDKHPKWSNIDYALYLKGVVQTYAHNYTDAIMSFDKISYSFAQHAEKATASLYSSIGKDTLETLFARFPDHKILGKLVDLTKKVRSSQMQVAVLLPFENSIKNRFILELYGGILCAVDSLSKAGYNINLVPLETGKDTVKIKETISKINLNSFDLIIGPLYTPQQSFVASKSDPASTVVVNPLTSYNTMSNQYTNYFLYRPSYETQGKSASNFVFSTFPVKNSVIIYGEDVGDSLMAYSYKNDYEYKGGKILVCKKLTRGTSNYFEAILKKIPIDSIGHVFVSSNESSLAANVFSYLEAQLLEKTATYKDMRTDEEKEAEKEKKRKELEKMGEKVKKTSFDIPIIAPSSWLSFESISIEQFNLHNTHFIFTHCGEEPSDINEQFKNQYLSKIGIYPTDYSYIGYELMMYFAQNISQTKANKFQFLKDKSITKGVYQQYFDYSTTNDNGFVPIVKIENLKLKIVNIPAK